MGNPSLSIMMHEILKLLHYARAEKGVKFIRIGTCGGVGVPLGTTVITEKVYNGLFQPYLTQHILGNKYRDPPYWMQVFPETLCTTQPDPR